MTRPDTKRTRQILIRVSADEDRQIRERAAALGLSVSALLRAGALGTPERAIEAEQLRRDLVHLCDASLSAIR